MNQFQALGKPKSSLKTAVNEKDGIMKPADRKRCIADESLVRSFCKLEEEEDQGYQHPLPPPTVQQQQHDNNQGNNVATINNNTGTTTTGSDEEETRNRAKFQRWRHKVWQCDDCERMFTLKHNLQNHYIQYHMGCKTLHKACPSCKCGICGRIYSAASVLAEHMTEAHDIHVKREECPICSEKFLTPIILNKHIKQEHSRQSKQCPFEGCEHLSFKFCKDLNEHVRMNHKNAEMSCSVCHMSFRQVSAKLRHEGLHMKEANHFEMKRARITRSGENDDIIKTEPNEVKNEQKSPPNSHKRAFHPQLEAIPIKRKTTRRMTKDEILAKIK